MKKTFLKAALAVLLICASVFCFAACGNSAAKVEEAKSADGGFGDIDWDYDSKTKKLTIEGSGAINFDSAEDADWYEVRHSVEKIDFDTDEITEIGDYAFYYMPQLTEVSIPDSVTVLGDYAFAFCSSLESIDGQLPLGLTAIGEGCFESCIALETMTVPASVETIGARAFAHCSSLETVDIYATLGEIGKWTFKGCSSLDSLTMHESNNNEEIIIDEAAFEDCKLDFEDVDFSKSAEGNVTITINYVYENGEEAHETYTEELTKNDKYEVGTPEIEGFTADKAVVEGYAKKDTEITVTYKETVETEAAAEVEETETEAAVEEEPKSRVGSIIAIVIMVVVILAIVGLVIFMVISDKKNAAKGNSRASKNGDKKNKRK